MTTSSELGYCSSVTPTEYSPGKQSKWNYCTNTQKYAFLAESTGTGGMGEAAVNSSDLILGSTSGGAQWGGRHGASSSLESCPVYAHSWPKAHRSKRRICFSPVKPALMLFVHCHNIILLPL